MGITTKEIAKICGVSRTTVHRALNNTGRISEKTKRMILETAEKNGIVQIFWLQGWQRERHIILVLL